MLRSAILILPLLCPLACGRSGPTPEAQKREMLAELQLRFQVFDTNQDGRIDVVEYFASPAAKQHRDGIAAFHRIDTDGDDFLSPFEVQAAIEHHAAQHGR